MDIAALIVLGVIAVVIVGLILRGIGAYNKLVQLLERTKNAFAQIDVQLERRYDLIPNLVEVAKGYMSHEKDTLEAVMQARASATQARIHVGGDPTNAAAMGQLGQAEGMLTGALGRLMAVAENYPDLKANQNMMQLTEELTATENRVAFARQGFNDQTNVYRAYKGALIMPLLVAKIAGFEDVAYLEIEEAAKREAPKVSF
ncbi:MAG: LemA family protein [Planctomycetota bacterium]